MHCIGKQKFSFVNKFEMFKSQWYVLRKVEGVKRIPAIYFMLIFAYKGFRKYIK